MLSMILYHPTGQSDRASEFVRRCLFVLECSYSERFRPWEGGEYRINAKKKSNRTYFVALFRHMQMVGYGGPRTNAAVDSALSFK